jgi:hypothetical protein
LFSSSFSASFVPTGYPPINDIITAKNASPPSPNSVLDIGVTILENILKKPQLNNNRITAVKGNSVGIIIFEQMIIPSAAELISSVGFVMNRITKIHIIIPTTRLFFDILSPLKYMF